METLGRYAPALCRKASRMLGSAADAEDVVQTPAYRDSFDPAPVGGAEICVAVRPDESGPEGASTQVGAEP